jgi:hypothetical protein
MKKMLLVVSLTLAMLFPLQAGAIQPGKVTGTFTVEKDVVTLKYAYAHLHDNAEGWLKAKEMRILLTDREVPQELLAGLDCFPGLSKLNKQGKLRGVLFRFDPAKTNAVEIDILYPTEKKWLTTALDWGNTSPIKGLKISEKSVRGSFTEHMDYDDFLDWPERDFNMNFSAPLTKEPAITANLSGDKALKSPQMATLLAKFAALTEGNLQKAEQYATESATSELDTMIKAAGNDALPMVRQWAKEQEDTIKKGPLKLVERGDKAKLVVGTPEDRSMFSFVKEGGKWKTE